MDFRIVDLSRGLGAPRVAWRAADRRLVQLMLWESVAL